MKQQILRWIKLFRRATQHQLFIKKFKLNGKEEQLAKLRHYKFMKYEYCA